ncbi:MAG: hypothetical protein K6E96_05220 [Bacteroidales bacterium]|nr:hypothetical protein [Bacteroidales bacterium]
MRKGVLLFCLVGTVLLTACQGKEKSRIETTAYRYSEAMANYRIDDAEPYATAETQATTLKAARQMTERIGQEYIDSDTPATIEITSVGIVNDTEAYALYHKTTPLKNFQDTVHLRKRDGQWLVHFPLRIVKRPTKQELDETLSKMQHVDSNGNPIREFKIPTK